ncbi:MAG: substrate-binding domain-containing protein, partial [Bacteroidota bacterium]
ESLIKSGRKKIALLSNAPQLSITNERLSGYMKALADYHIHFKPELIRNCSKGGNDYQEVEDAVKDLLAMPEKPDAMFISSDRISISCVRALKNLNSDPKEIAVAGFSNSDVVDLLQPPISYVKQKAFEMGQVAVEMLLKLIESKYPITEFETRVLDTELHLIK